MHTADGWCGFDCHSGYNGHTIGYSSNNTPSCVGGGFDLLSFQVVLIIGGTGRCLCQLEAESNFHTLNCSDSHQCPGQISVEFIKNRFSQSRRDIEGYGFHHTTQGISLFLGFKYLLFHELGGLLVSAAHLILPDVLCEATVSHVLGFHISHLSYMGHHLNIQFFQELFSHCSPYHVPDGVSATAPATSTVVVGTVLGSPGVITVAGSGLVPEGFIGR